MPSRWRCLTVRRYTLQLEFAAIRSAPRCRRLHRELDSPLRILCRKVIDKRRAAGNLRFVQHTRSGSASHDPQSEQLGHSEQNPASDPDLVSRCGLVSGASRRFSATTLYRLLCQSKLLLRQHPKIPYCGAVSCFTAVLMARNCICGFSRRMYSASQAVWYSTTGLPNWS